jgi:hypothetical protein
MGTMASWSLLSAAEIEAGSGTMDDVQNDD